MNHVILLKWPSLYVERVHKNTAWALQKHNSQPGPCFIAEVHLRRCYELCRAILENEEKIKAGQPVNIGGNHLDMFNPVWGICTNAQLSTLPSKYVGNTFKLWNRQIRRVSPTHLTAPVEGNLNDYEYAAKNNTLWQNEDRWSLLKYVLYELGKALSAIDDFHAANPIPTINTSLLGDEDAKTKEPQT